MIAPGIGAISLTRLPSAADRELMMGVRPDGMSISPDLQGEGFAAQVVYTEYLGDSAYVYVKMGEGAPVSIRCTPDTQYAPDTPVKIRVMADKLHFFSSKTSQRLAV